LELHPNHPNPFNPSTAISFSLPSNAHVKLVVYDITGQEVATVAKGNYGAGKHTVVFSPKNLPSGIYFYALQAGAERKVRRLMYVK
jgi:hypothetical protein